MAGDLAKNRKAFHEFHVLETFEAGIELRGTEVKSCRAKNISVGEGYAQVVDGEVILYNVHIDEYDKGNIHNHDPRRPRRLLLHKAEIRKLFTATRTRGLTLVPLGFYLKRGRVKVGLGLCRGKSRGDKREALKERDADREMQQRMKR